MTQRLYQKDSYRTEFEALVVAITPRGEFHAVELDQTVFYPETGGQPSDTGSIGGVRIEEVVEDGARILHMASGKPDFVAGDRVRGAIDWGRRLVNMQQHTGQHVLSQAFLQVLDAATVSSRLGLEHSTIDVAVADLTWDAVKATENMANLIVFENRPVLVFEAGKDEVEGLRMKMPIDRDLLRIVEVEDFDRSPCGGTHTRTTGEIGPIKIVRWERVRATARVEFVCGSLAMDDYFWKNRFVVDLAQDLTTKDTNLPAQIPQMLEERKSLAKEAAELRRELARYRAGELLAGAREVAGVRVVMVNMADAPPQEARDMASALTQNPRTVALTASGRGSLHLVLARSSDVDLDMRPAMQAACAVVDGRGGGKPEVCQGGGKYPERAGEALEAAAKIVEAALCPS